MSQRVAALLTSRRAFLSQALRLGAGLGALPFVAACAASTPPAAPAPGPAAARERGGAPAPSPRPLREVVFATSAGGSAMGLVTTVIKRHQLDEKHGLLLDLKPFDPADAEKAVLIGSVEAGFFVPISWAKVNLEGQEVSFLAPIYTNHGAVLVRAEAPYQTMADLRGKRIATLGHISGLYTSMQVLMREMGMDWERDFELVAGPAPAVVAALERGDVEAGVPFEPNTSALLATGRYREVMNPNDTWQQLTGSPLFMVGLAARQSWIDQNRDTARALKATILDATRYIREHPEVFEEEREALGIQNETHLALVKARMSRIYLPEQDAALVRTIDQLLTRAVELGVLPEKPRKEIFVNP
ncbi:MAG TPA: ABC transporter substrate-binding protein [Chloroflexota bacterium]|nr:ABC transporter substrate-binding protein [Chloroflexota bacterium]